MPEAPALSSKEMAELDRRLVEDFRIDPLDDDGERGTVRCDPGEDDYGRG